MLAVKALHLRRSGLMNCLKYFPKIVLQASEIKE
jgi:hypothetical protein